MKKPLLLLRQYALAHQAALIWGSAGLLAALVLFANYRLSIFQRSIQFNYGGPTCFRDITLLPSLFKVQGSDVYGAHAAGITKLNGYPVLATSTCIVAKEAPAEHEREVVTNGLLGNPLLKKRFAITTPPLPKLRANPVEQTLSPKEPLLLQLDQADQVFTYYIQAGDKRQQCTFTGNALSCGVDQLELAQGTIYELTIERFFGDERLGSVLQQTVTTTSPVAITASSVVAGGVVYDSPTQLRLTASKPLVSAEIVLERLADNQRHTIEQKSEVAGTDIVITLTKPLDRNASFELTLRSATAEDKGYLEKAYILPFTVSGGPKVTSVNISRSGVDQNSSIVISFDQALGSGQDLPALISFKNANVAAGFTASASGNKLTIKPNGALGRCSTFSVTLGDDLKSNHGISGNSGWSYSARTTCYTTSIIGYSVRGRAITAYRFGSGASKVIYLGGTHGNEKSSKYLLDQWINELDANPDKIPAHRTIIVIPNLNPDGFASSNRRNAHNVDLNRNFPANNWKPNVTMPGGEYIVNGAGASPLSEPESAAITNFVRTENPRLVLTYHAVASIVSANGAGDSATLASKYASLSRYRNLPFGESESVFQYDTTGAFEDWLYDKEGITALLIELGSYSNSEWSRNKAAMWAMVGI